MTVEFVNETETDLGLDLEAIAREVIEHALDTVGCPYEAEVSLTITGPEEVHQINKEFRGIDNTTDVLSFPMLEYQTPGDFAFLEEAEEENEDLFNPETGELVLGDIVINTDRVISQAEDYGHSVKREYAFLITHSILHLCGFDHMVPEEAAVMEEWQRRILDDLKIVRE